MRKLGIAFAVAALCCLTVSASTGNLKSAGNYVITQRPVQVDGGLHHVKGVLGNVTGNKAPRFTIVYDNTTNATGSGYAPSQGLGSEFGDELVLTGSGQLVNIGFGILQFQATMTSVDLELNFYDVSVNWIATYNVGTIDLSGLGGLAPGYAATIDDLDLTAQNITVPSTIVVTETYSNTVPASITSVGTLIFDPPTVGTSYNYFYRDGGWYWFGGSPVANFYNRARVATPVPTAPPVYDNTTGTVVSGTADPPRHWMGDDITTEDYTAKVNDPPWALNYGVVDEIRFTFWNYNAAASNAAGVLSADLTFQFFDRADTSAVIGSPIDVTFDFTGFGDRGLDQFYFVTATLTNVAEYVPFTKADHQYGIRYRTTNITWTTHTNVTGEIGQIIRRPGNIGTTDPGIFYLDPLDTGEDQYGGEDGWYSFTSGTAAALHYGVNLRNWEPCDANCDGAVDNFDIDAFVLALTDPLGFAATYPTCNISTSDANEDGSIDNFDIDPFVSCLTGK